MKYLSCYKVLAADDQTNGGIGQGGGNYHTQAVGIDLQKAIAAELGAELMLSPRLHGSNSYNGGPYDIPAGKFDTAYVQLFETPKKRPADFVWSMISDYIGLEPVLEHWLAQTQPNLLISLQYPVGIGSIPKPPVLNKLAKMPDLVGQCAGHDCQVVHMPWFNAAPAQPWIPEKEYTAMCTGKMSGTYPWRDAVYHYLQTLHRSDIVLSGNPHGSTFRLSDEEYHRALGRTKYYFTGGIYDLQIPPKVFEVCNYGACLVMNDMPMLESCGFVHGETCLVISSLEAISFLLAADHWYLIAKAGQKLVQERHSLSARAKQIATLIQEMTT